jgi:hypothetical protein
VSSILTRGDDILFCGLKMIGDGMNGERRAGSGIAILQCVDMADWE